MAPSSSLQRGPWVRGVRPCAQGGSFRTCPWLQERVSLGEPPGGPWPCLRLWVPRSSWSSRLPQSPVRPRARLRSPGVGGPGGSDPLCKRVLLSGGAGGRGNLKRILQEPGLGSVVENGLLEISCAWARCAWGGKAKATLNRELGVEQDPGRFSVWGFVCLHCSFVLPCLSG